MALDLTDYQKKAAKAVKAFWNSRNASHTKQLASGKVDAGTRGAVTSGKNMNGFVSLLIDLIKANGLKDANIIRDGRVPLTLPGYFRPTKMWDMLVIHDLWTAYREGSFGESMRPFVGWLMLVEDAPGSRSAVSDRS